MSVVRLSAGDETAMARLAARIAACARTGDVITLSGTLGAGKTVFARAFIRALTGPETDVPSPTFNLVLVHEGAEGEIWHFDLYRLEDAAEIYALGIEDALDNAISLIEWPEIALPLLPEARLDIRIDIGEGNERRIALPPGGDWPARLKACALPARNRQDDERSG